MYFIGYIKKGAFDDGSGIRYRLRTILDPVDNNVGSSTWTNLNVAPATSSTVHSIFWALQYTGSGAGVGPYTYAREVGSSNASVTQAKNRDYYTNFLLTVDSNKEVQHYMDSADTQSWIFAYIEEYVRKAPRTMIVNT